MNATSTTSDRIIILDASLYLAPAAGAIERERETLRSRNRNNLCFYYDLTFSHHILCSEWNALGGEIRISSLWVSVGLSSYRASELKSHQEKLVTKRTLFALVSRFSELLWRIWRLSYPQPHRWCPIGRFWRGNKFIIPSPVAAPFTRVEGSATRGWPPDTCCRFWFLFWCISPSFWPLDSSPSFIISLFSLFTLILANFCGCCWAFVAIGMK